MRVSRSFFPNNCGATSIEYAFIACLVALTALASMGLAGNALANTLFITSNQMNTAPGIAAKG